MKLIAVVGENWEIGRGSQCCFSISDDRKRFAKLTDGCTVIMGRKTHEAIVEERGSIVDEILPGRLKIVMTRDSSFHAQGVTVCTSLGALLEKASDNSWVIGGEQIYEQLLPLCDEAYITEVNACDELVDRFLPNLRQRNDWVMIDEGPWSSDGDGVYYRYVLFRRVKDAT